MANRIGAVVVLVDQRGDIANINRIISEHSDLVLGRQGIPLRDRSINVISLVLEGNTDRMGSLTGQLGKLPGVKVKSVVAG